MTVLSYRFCNKNTAFPYITRLDFALVNEHAPRAEPWAEPWLDARPGQQCTYHLENLLHDTDDIQAMTVEAELGWFPTSDLIEFVLCHDPAISST